jgi:hypothetical protein
MVIPWLQGALLAGAGAQALAQLVVVATFLMLLILVAITLTDRRQKHIPVAQTISGSSIAK